MSFDMHVIWFGLPILLGGLVNTILFCVAASLFGITLALPVALFHFSKVKALNWTAYVFVEIIRNTPFLIQVFILYYGLASIGIRLNATAAGIFALTLYAAANFSESIRSAILSVPRGQGEAARAVGLSSSATLFRIIMPQALGYLVPTITNQVIGVIKESAALSVITVPEISMSAQVVIGETFSPIESYAMVALLYWGLCTSVVGMLAYFGKSPGIKRAAPSPMRLAMFLQGK